MHPSNNLEPKFLGTEATIPLRPCTEVPKFRKPRKSECSGKNEVEFECLVAPLSKVWTEAGKGSAFQISKVTRKLDFQSLTFD